MGLRRAVRTIEEETLEGLFHVELCVEDDEPEADWKCVVASATLEKVSDGIEGVVVRFLGEKLRARPGSAGRRLSLWRAR